MVHDCMVFNLTKEDSKKVLDVLMIPTPEPAPKEEEYVFKAGDVVRGGYGGKRIIVEIDHKLKSFSIDGHHQSTGQQEFIAFGYKKIGNLSDFIK